MEKFFKLRALGIGAKFKKDKNKFLIKGYYKNIFFESSGEDLEETLNKFYNFSIELLESIKNQ